MSQPYLSKERAKSLLVEIVNGSPRGSTNAREGNSINGVCLYDNPEAKGNAQRRCIVGEILHRMGMPMPTRNKGASALTEYVAKRYMTQDTLQWLADVQRRFDGKDYIRPKTAMGFDGRWPPRTWRSALKLCRSEGLL